MTIEAGVLSLRITEQGADQVLKTLNAIDAKASALGNKFQSVRFNAPSATGVSGQLQQLSAKFTEVQNAATAATPAIDKHAEAQTRTAKATKTAADQLGQSILGYYSVNQIVNTAVRIFDEFNEAADRQANAQRRLGATATFTGASLAQIKGIAADAQQQFKLSTGDSANLTAAFARLAFMSGNVGQTGKLMTAWMNLAASQGLTLEQVMTGVNSTIGGQDEGLNRLGLMNPSGIWKKWADALGTTVGKMTDQQKFQAIINELLEQGGKLTGEYGRYLETTQGKQQAFNSSLEQFNAHIGMAGFGVRSLAYDLGTMLMNAIVNADNAMDKLAARTSTFFGVLFRGGSLSDAKAAVGKQAFDAGLASDPNLENATAQMNAQIAADKKRKDDAARFAKEEAAREAERLRKEAERERREALKKAMGTDMTSLGEIGLTAHGPAGPMVAPTVGVGKDGKMKGVKGTPAEALADAVLGTDKDVREAIARKKEFIGGLLQGVAESIGGAFSNAFTAAFQGGNFLAELGKSLLSSLGGMIVQLGESMLTYGTLMAVGAPLLMATPFAAQAMSAPAAIAAGIGLIALGAGMGAIGGKGGGKGSGGSSAHGSNGQGNQQDNAFALAFDPDRKLRKSKAGSVVGPNVRGLDSSAMPEGRPVVQIGVLNALHPDDPRWQRELATTYNNASGRGLIKKAG